jgi:hypothetical protein
VYSPTETLAMFMTQALSQDGSCRAVVNAAAVRRALEGEEPLATNTSADCQARARLPLPMIATLAREAAGLVTKSAPGWWLWQGRRVRLVDGATVTLSDTLQNQATSPQPASQKAGPGFPIARLVALMCLATGAVLDAALGPCAGKGSDEQTLLRKGKKGPGSVYSNGNSPCPAASADGGSSCFRGLPRLRNSRRWPVIASISR